MPGRPIEIESARRLAMAALLCAAGIVVPIVFHAAGLGRVFLPMHLPVLVAGLILPVPDAVLVGVLTPWASALLTGMPPLITAGSMSVELAVLAASAAVLAGLRLPLWLASAAAIILRACVTWLVTSWLAGYLGLPPRAAGWAAVVSGAPGIALQILFAPPLAALIRREMPWQRTADHEGT